MESPVKPGAAGNLAALPLLIWVVFKGWAGLVARGFRTARAFLSGLPIAQLLFLFSCVALIVAAMPAWISYSVNFSTPEVVRVGSSFRAMFVLPGFLGIFLCSTKLPFRFLIFLLAYGACVAAYAGGFFFPNPIHTEIIQSEDFSLTFWAFLYAGPLVGCGIFARSGLAVPIFDWNRLFTKLSEET